MRHQVKGRKLGRTTAHRKATMRALSSALIKEHRIVTTVSKAKELRGFIEPLITRAKVDNSLNRKKVFSALQDKRAVHDLFGEVAPAAVDRPGGYTRVLKLGYRQGDSAELAVIELVDFNDVKPEKRSTKKRRTRRAGRSNKPDTAPVTEKPEEKEMESKEAEIEGSGQTEEIEKSTTEEASAKEAEKSETVEGTAEEKEEKKNVSDNQQESDEPEEESGKDKEDSK